MTAGYTSRMGTTHGLTGKWLVRLGILLVLLLILPVLAIPIALRFPAALLEGPVLSLTHGQVRLALASGQVRSGKAELWVRDPANREWQPWIPIEWALNFAWRRNRPLAELTTNVGSIAVSGVDLTMNDVKVWLPPNLLLLAVDHPMAKAPWRGDISLTSRRFACERRGLHFDWASCEGTATVRWRGTGSSILPLPEYGDYLVDISARRADGGVLRADVSTASGVVSINGFVETRQGPGRYRLVVGSEQSLVVGLNTIIGPLAPQRSESGEYILEGGWQ